MKILPLIALCSAAVLMIVGCAGQLIPETYDINPPPYLLGTWVCESEPSTTINVLDHNVLYNEPFLNVNFLNLCNRDDVLFSDDFNSEIYTISVIGAINYFIVIDKISDTRINVQLTTDIGSVQAYFSKV